MAPLNVSEDKDAHQHEDGSWGAPMVPERVMHTMVSGQVSTQIVGAVSEGIDPDGLGFSVDRMVMEMEWASHLTCQACMIPFPKHAVNPKYAQCVNACLNDPVSSLCVWMRVPMESVATTHLKIDNIDSWNVWHGVRVQCGHHVRLGVALEVDELSTVDDFKRWLGEPIKAIIVHQDTFEQNSRGVPVLPDHVARVLLMACTHGIQVILDTVGSGDVSESSRVYWEYLSFLFRKQPPLGEEDVLEIPYRDFLQAPLQPLQDNLESQTYETFERDSPKYTAYEEAIYQALTCRSSSEGRVVVMVVGAGRGPLVAATLLAATRAGQDVKVYAVEKNRNAIVHLYARHNREAWHDTVTIVHADMRLWNPSFEADIMVSELLGSFGDNELSPECLYGAQKFLKRDGISIPCSYTSYLSPITAAKAWSEVSVRGSNPLEHFETPFVVRLHSYREIDRSKKVFEFEHPHWGTIDNERSITIDFVNAETYDVICHGFAGYFEAILYGDVMLSILPETHTENMHSWFPIFFPLRDPCHLPAGATMSASMWRRTSSSRVWYEWAISRPYPSPIHNPNGRSYHVGL